jgi:hypothetical protein
VFERALFDNLTIPDKLFQAQFRWNHLPARVSGHSLRPEVWTLTDLASPIRNAVLVRLADKFDDFEKTNEAPPQTDEWYG